MSLDPQTNTVIDEFPRANKKSNSEEDRYADLIEMIMSLSSEICILRDRLDTHERLAELDLPISHENVEGFEPDQAVNEFRSRERQTVVSKVLRVVRKRLANTTADSSERVNR